MHAEGRTSGAAKSLNVLPVFCRQRHEFARRSCRFVGGLPDACEEKTKPRLPVTRQTHVLEQVVVLLAVALKEKTEIEEWLAECAFSTEQERDEQAAQASIPGSRVFELASQAERGSALAHYGNSRVHR